MLDCVQRNSLTDIANRCGTDKGSVAKAGHGYTIVYDDLFRYQRDLPISLLEIGLMMGGPEVEGGAAEREITDAPSVKMWHEYFPNALITGVDISDFSQFENNWFKFYRVDCGKPSDYDKITGTFDIIVDDGSHASYHQQLALAKLFPLLRSGGLYIIEDLNWQPRQYEDELPISTPTATVLSDYIKIAFLPPLLKPLAELFAKVRLYDEDVLYTRRKAFNAEHGLTPQTYHYMDRKTVRGWVRRKARGTEIKLAVIVKA